MTLLALLFSLACSGSSPEATDAKSDTTKDGAKDGAGAAGGDCPAAVDKVAGTTWVYLEPQRSGPDKPNPIARMRFREENGALKAEYTAGSLGDVFTYDCAESGGILTCVESDLHAEAWCKAWASVHDGVCDAEGVAKVLGKDPSLFKAAAEKVNKELKGLSKSETETQRKVDNSAANKIQAKFMAALSPKDCRLIVQDKYLTMQDGTAREMSNVIDGGKFQKVTEEYVWSSCKDISSTTVKDSAGAESQSGAPGTWTFEATLPKDTKADASCTYTADIYKDWQPFSQGVAAKTDGGKVTFSTAIPFTDKGKHTVYFDRIKTCGEKKESLGITCGAVRVE